MLLAQVRGGGERVRIRGMLCTGKGVPFPAEDKGLKFGMQDVEVPRARRVKGEGGGGTEGGGGEEGRRGGKEEQAEGREGLGLDVEVER